MPSETRTCQNCKQSFTVEPEDFAFYEKIKVPPPTWCPECRLVRRLSFMNERTLYYSDNCMYGTFLEESKDSVDNYIAFSCERCYDSSNLYKDYNVRYSKRCNECTNVSFSLNLQNCNDCFGCANLKNKQYHIFNAPYSKEEYAAKLLEFDFGSFVFVEEMKKKISSIFLQFPRRYVEGLNNENVIGDYIFHSKNCFYCCEVLSGENCKYCHFLSIAPTKDSYDYTRESVSSNVPERSRLRHKSSRSIAR